MDDAGRENERRERTVGWMVDVTWEREHPGETEELKDDAGLENECQERAVG
jgi:hypothetical protein